MPSLMVWSVFPGYLDPGKHLMTHLGTLFRYRFNHPVCSLVAPTQFLRRCCDRVVDVLVGLPPAERCQVASTLALFVGPKHS